MLERGADEAFLSVLRGPKALQLTPSQLEALRRRSEAMGVDMDRELAATREYAHIHGADALKTVRRAS